MFRKIIHKLVLFVLLNSIITITTGCATHSIWEKNHITYNPKTLITKSNATAKGIYSKCNQVKSFNKIIIPFVTKDKINDFPPFNEGYMVISYNKQTKRMIKNLNEILTSDKYKLSFDNLEAIYMQTVDPVNYTQYWSDYTFTTTDRYGNLRRSSASRVSEGETEIYFVPKTEGSKFGNNCESLIEGSFNFHIEFIKNSLKYNVYKNSLEYRIVATPFSVIADVITSPLQFIAFITVPIWMPR